MEQMLADPMFPVIAVVGLASLAGVGWVLAGGGQSSQAKKRVKSVAQRAPTRGRRAGVDTASQRRRQVQDTLKDLEAKQKRQRKRTLTLKAQMEQAGLNITLKTFWIISAVAGVVGGVLGLASGRGPIVAAALLIVFGLGLPRWTVGFLRGRRLKKFASEFPNAIDVIVRGVKAGLPLNECFKIIANEAPPPVGEEFGEFVESLAVGVPIEEALKRMYERMPLQELGFFGVVLAIQQKTGGNLAEALGNLSGVIRSRKTMREKIGAYSSEAKASALIIGSLPPGVCAMVYFTSPDYMSLMFTETMGRLMLLGGAVWMGIGIFMMKKMISFKI
jgi:tight adherence protein B